MSNKRSGCAGFGLSLLLLQFGGCLGVPWSQLETDSGTGGSSSDSVTSSTGSTGQPPGCTDGVALPGEFCFAKIPVPEIRFPISIAEVRMDAESASSFAVLDLGTERLLRVAWDDGAFYVLPIASLPVRSESRVQSTCLFDEGRDDLVTTSLVSTTLRMFANEGDTISLPMTHQITGGGPGVFFDNEGDGVAEMIAGEAGNALLWKYDKLADLWTKHPAEYPIPGCGVLWSSTTADFNSDGLEDVAYIGSPLPVNDKDECSDVGHHRVIVLVSNPEIGYPLIADSIPLDFYADDIDSGDLDGDGVMDLVLASGEAHYRVVVMPGLGGGTFGPPLVVSNEHNQIAVGNLDGDPHAEIVASGLDSFVVIDSPLGDLSIHPLDVRGRPERIADVDGDGVGDVAFDESSYTDPTTLSVLISTP